MWPVSFHAKQLSGPGLAPLVWRRQYETSIGDEAELCYTGVLQHRPFPSAHSPSSHVLHGIGSTMEQATRRSSLCGGAALVRFVCKGMIKYHHHPFS